jgi:hypothetical protein
VENPLQQVYIKTGGKGLKEVSADRDAAISHIRVRQIVGRLLSQLRHAEDRPLERRIRRKYSGYEVAEATADI